MKHDPKNCLRLVRKARISILKSVEPVSCAINALDLAGPGGTVAARSIQRAQANLQAALVDATLLLEDSQ